MYVIKNALRNLTRAKGRSILNLILVLIIATSACVSLSIRQSAESVKQSSYNSLSVTAQISVDREKIMQNSGQDKDSMREAMSKSLTLDEMETYAKSSYVNDFIYTLTTSLNGSDSLTAFSTSSNSSSSNSPNNPFGGTEMMKGMSQGDFSIKGYSSHDSMTEFINGTYKIKSGSMFDEDDSTKNCIISSELANENSLTVGSTLVFKNPKNEEETFEATVSGIYENNDSTSTEDIPFGGADPANTIFMSYNSVKALIDESSENPIEVTDNNTNSSSTSVLTSRISGTYVLSDVTSYESFKNDVENMGLDTSIYTVSSSDASQYEESIAPLDNLSKYTMIFFLVVLCIGALILVVFNLFTIKTRKYEIGVLSAIGMNKFKVAMQFVIESVVITLIASILGATIGAISSDPIADKLLSDQVTAVQESNETYSNNFGGNFQGNKNGGQMGMGLPSGKVPTFNMPGQSAEVNYIDSISTSTNLTVIIELVGVCLLLTIVSSMIAMISILRYNPLKILSDRV